VVTFTVAAQGCQRQESQLAILPPGATSTVLLQNGAWVAAFSWDTTALVPGNYRISLYTRRVGYTGPYQAAYQGDYALR